MFIDLIVSWLLYFIYLKVRIFTSHVPFKGITICIRPITLITILFLGLGCGHKNAEVERTSSEPEIPPASVPVDNRNGEQFIAVIDENGNSITLTTSELETIDKLLQHRITEYNKGKGKEYPISLIHYKRQYFPTVNSKGEKEVEVNCFCQVDANDSWKKYRVRVNDGGNCYFNLKLNLAKESVLNFSVNGLA